jgi:hypothetical protein
MTDPRTTKRYALLVGIDLYLNNGSRKLANGSSLSINSLHGCVNDVTAVKAFLQHEYHLDKHAILTSSAPDTIDKGAMTPMESPDRLPTFDNIKQEIDTVHSQATAGDFFFFHFSGHGARLKPVKSSPAGRPDDPSLLTVDFCCGQPALRGWQLNNWLKKLNDKNVYVIVVLDSCHAGASWRTGNCFRTPNWPTVPSLPADEVAVKEDAFIKPSSRSGKVETSWRINPEGFTLMAACDGEEQAAEMIVNGRAVGAFTYALLNCLAQNRATGTALTYRTIRDQVAQRLKEQRQNPKVYGRDRLLFFESKEPFSQAILLTRIEDDMVIVPVGRVHGVHRKSEFALFPPISETAISIEEVRDFECSAKISPEMVQTLQEHQFKVIPSRWSLGDELFQILVGPAFGPDFQKSLCESLQNRIASSVEVIQLGENQECCTNLLRLEKWGDEVKIFGPKSLIGYSGPVRGLQLKGYNITELATDAAVALSHLARFKQILDLRTEASQESPPFELALEPANSGISTDNQIYKFVFENKSEDELYFTVMVLGPGFSVQQLFPPQDYPEKVARRSKRSFPFHIYIPNELQRVCATGESIDHRDIVRTLVTRGKALSWKVLELPDIWDAGQPEIENRSRNAFAPLLEHNFDWWIQDREVVTSSV